MGCRVLAILVVCAVLAAPAPTQALPWMIPAVPAAMQPAQAPLPTAVGYVNDFANVLSPEASAQIESLARRVNAATKGDMVVVTLPDLAGRSVEEVGLRLGREWKVGADAAIGDEARNAGVIILLVPKETSADGRGYCRIEVGQGAEGFLTDATAGALCRSQAQLFQAQDYSAALVQISAEVADRYARAFGVTLDSLPLRPHQEQEDSPYAMIILLVIVALIVTSMNRRGGCGGCVPIVPLGSMSGTRGGWSGTGGFGGYGGGFGGRGGGFGGFGGGGGFSGGGGGSSW